MKQYEGLWVREGTYDEYVIKEQKRSYGHLDYTDRVVMDAGGNIGAFARYAIARGAKAVHTYEPLPANMEVLLKNVEGYPTIHHYQYALVPDDTSQMDLWYVPGGKNPGNTSLHVQRGRSSVKVNCANFFKEIEAMQPDVLKMDIEGAEYDILNGYRLPDSVKQVVVEIHLTKKAWKEEAPRLVQSFENWEALKPIDLNTNRWTVLGSWRRS